MGYRRQGVPLREETACMRAQRQEQFNVCLRHRNKYRGAVGLERRV